MEANQFRDGLTQILPDVAVLRAPGVIQNYRQLEAVQKTMLPEFSKAFDAEGFKLVAWGEAGEYRYFSMRPIRTPSDIKAMRPWLWPSRPTDVPSRLTRSSCRRT